MNNDKYIDYLVEKLREAGLTQGKGRGARQTVYHWIKIGKLTLRQRPTSKWYVVNDDEVREIIAALSPGGEGFWHFK